jgi:hypothetical protein
MLDKRITCIYTKCMYNCLYHERDYSLLHVIQTIAKYEIFPTEIPQGLQRRHWGFPTFLTYDVTKVVPTKVQNALYHIGCIYQQNRCISIEYILNVR